MKIKSLERMRETQRLYHQQCRWLMEDGIYAPHCYDNTPADALSWWDDVGFILGQRRVIVWWTHPRHRYALKMEEQAWAAMGEPPTLNGQADKQAIHQRLGRSRKKTVGYTLLPQHEEKQAYFDQLHQRNAQLQRQGIDDEVPASWRRKRLSWATGVELVAPLEVRNQAELRQVADLARRLLRQETTLEQAFPGYRYGKQDWLAEHPA